MMITAAYNTVVDELHRWVEMHSSETIDVDTNLLEQGIVDSLLVMDLTIHLERAWGIRLEPEDVVPRHYQSISALATLVERKLGAQQRGADIASRMSFAPACSEFADFRSGVT